MLGQKTSDKKTSSLLIKSCIQVSFDKYINNLASKHYPDFRMIFLIDTFKISNFYDNHDIIYTYDYSKSVDYITYLYSTNYLSKSCNK